MSMRSIGPAGMSGRITSIDVDQTNHIIYVGSASGGLWTSNNNGVSWKPIFDEQETQSIGSVKVNQRNPLEIWVGTGEGNPRNSHNSGTGIYKTLDGGKTWTNMGLQNSKLIHRILIDQDNPDVVYAGIMGSAWGPSTERGVFKTIDGGKNWKKSLYVNDSTGIGELVMDPQNPKKLIANMWQFYRKPWQMISGGSSSGIYITYDGGDHWKKISSTEGLPAGNLGKCGLAISKSDPNMVYALIEAKENGLYKSTNGGDNWTKVIEDKGFNGRPFYFYEIYVDPTNSNVIYSLHTYLNKSIDGGKTYKSIADYGNAVHPDHHAFWIDPSNPNYLLEGNDGGLNVSYDAGQTWQFILNLPVGQFYHLNVDDDFPYHVYGGMQDNGTWVGPGFTLSAGGIRNGDWQEVYFGDGFDAAPIPNNNRFGYAMSQGGDLIKYDIITGKTESIRPVHPEDKPLRFNWNSGMAIDPMNPKGIYYGSQFLHYSSNEGVDWKIISPDLSTNDTIRQAKESGGLTPDITGAENNTTIISIAPSPIDAKVIWVGTDDGNVQLTRDGGVSWTNCIANIKNAPKGAWIPQIEVSSRDAGTAFVVLNNYRQNDYKPYLFYTTDFGKTWTNLVDESKVKRFINAVVQDKLEPNLLFVGADDGLYISFDLGKNWNHWTNNFPQVQIQDMKIQNTFNDLVIATFGRAFWVLDNIEPLRKISRSQGAILNREFAILATPDAYDVNYKSFAGSRFYAQADFNGSNKAVGAQFMIKTNFDEKKWDKKIDSAKIKDKKALVKIYNSNQILIRDYKSEVPDTGISIINWGLESNGLKLPSKTETKPDSDKPGGSKVAIGKYKVVLIWKTFSDSSYFEVKNDPRSEFNDLARNNQQKIIDEFRSFCEKTADTYEKVRDAKKAIDIIEKMSSILPDSTQKNIAKLNEAQRKNILNLENELFGPDAIKGLERDPDDIMSNVYAAMNYVVSAGNVIGSNANNKLRISKEKLNLINEKMNKYLNSEFVEYKINIGKLNLSPFKN
ncbi:MAG: hypothetical protein ABI851_13570 [Saprospiraceae bacterium]